MIGLELDTIQCWLVIVSGVSIVSMVALLIQCVCGKKGKDKQTDGIQSNTGHTSVFLDADALSKLQETQCDTGVENPVDVSTTPMNLSLCSNNGTLHSRGNSVDLNKDRRSGASSGSSPRPTLSRELPNIPGTHDRGHHSTLPTLPSESRNTSYLENISSSLDSHRKSSHVHTNLPDIPNGFHNHHDDRTKPTVSDETKYRTLPHVESKSSDMDDYDHIVEKREKKVRPRSDYDHVVIENGERRIIPAKSKHHENDYAEVKNGNFYEQVPQNMTVIPSPIPDSTSNQNDKKKYAKKEITKEDSFNDPYNKIKIDDPPYNRIKDDPPYNKIKESESDTMFIKVNNDSYAVDDPYNTVKEIQDDLDPYNIVNDDMSDHSSIRKRPGETNFKPSTAAVYDPYSTMLDEERNVSNQTDPYARVGDTESEIEDPYNKVVDDVDTIPIIAGASTNYGDDDYATVNKAAEAEYAKVNKSTLRKSYISDNDDMSASNRSLDASPREEIIHDEYATVVKVRKLSPSVGVVSSPKLPDRGSLVPSGSSDNVSTSRNNLNTSNGSSINQINPTNVSADNQIPPEPPRDYDDDDDNNIEEDIDHYNTVSMVTRENSTTGQDGRKKEPPYNKLSVRESLASMNARAASNTYEYVSDMDNLYATVDGNSGDGSIQHKTLPPTTENISCITDAPAPPSLDSLHETAKQHQDEIRRKHDVKPDYYNLDGTTQCQATSNGQGTPSSQGHLRTPSGDMMTSSFEGRVPIATEENVELDFDPNYQSVNVDKISDNVSEFDPNYETVEEAKAKSRYEEINGARPKIIRQHIYEDPDGELRPGETRLENGKIRAHVYEEVKLTNEAGRVRQRVMNHHTYEEVTDVKGKKGKKSNNSNNSNSESGKKKGHERSSSGDWLLFGKRKSGEPKDNKKKSNDKKPDQSGK
ncbi:hypothetical protein ACF0H5_022677 [Mactra antiquata]